MWPVTELRAERLEDLRGTEILTIFALALAFVVGFAAYVYLLDVFYRRRR